jgi:hypothetical protein
MKLSSHVDTKARSHNKTEFFSSLIRVIIADSRRLYPSLLDAGIARRIETAHLIAAERDIECRYILP